MYNTIFINASNSKSPDKCRDLFNSIYKYYDSKKFFLICALFNNQELHYELIEQFPNIRFIINDLNLIPTIQDCDDITYIDQEIIKNINKIIFSMNMINFISFGENLLSLSTEFICNGFLSEITYKGKLNLLNSKQNPFCLTSFSKSSTFSEFWDVPLLEKESYIFLKDLKKKSRFLLSHIFNKTRIYMVDYLMFVHFLKNENIIFDENIKYKKVSNFFLKKYGALSQKFSIEYLDYYNFQILKNKYN